MHDGSLLAVDGAGVDPDRVEQDPHDVERSDAKGAMADGEHADRHHPERECEHHRRGGQAPGRASSRRRRQPSGAPSRIREHVADRAHGIVPKAEASGCAKAFVCRYHGWTYGLDGALIHVPHERGFPDLEKSGRGLVPVEAFESHGFVFVQQEKGSGNRAALALDALPSPLIGDDYRIQDARNLGHNEVAANWKILLEGFIEGYHIRTTNRDTFYPLQYDNLNVIETFGANSRIAYPYRAIERQRGLAAEQR